VDCVRRCEGLKENIEEDGGRDQLLASQRRLYRTRRRSHLRGEELLVSEWRCHERLLKIKREEAGGRAGEDRAVKKNIFEVSRLFFSLAGMIRINENRERADGDNLNKIDKSSWRPYRPFVGGVAANGGGG
jgi:hypothetical protein